MLYNFQLLWETKLIVRKEAFRVQFLAIEAILQEWNNLQFDNMFRMGKICCWATDIISPFETCHMYLRVSAVVELLCFVFQSVLCNKNLLTAVKHVTIKWDQMFMKDTLKNNVIIIIILLLLLSWLLLCFCCKSFITTIE